MNFDHDENGNEVKPLAELESLEAAENQKPRSNNERLPDWLTRPAVEPYLATYHWYYKTLPKTPQEKQDEGYAMCYYNPCHIVKGKDFHSHIEHCPDRFIDDYVNSLMI